MRAAPSPPMPATAQIGRGFGLLWFGEGISLLGNATTSVLLPLLAVVQFHAGPAVMGGLTAAAWLPWLVIGLPAGAWTDGWPPRTVMIVADLVSAAALASVPIAWWLGVLSLVQLLVVALAGGTATVFFRTAYGKLIPLVVAPDRLEVANARLFGTESAAQVAGPGIGGLLAGLASATMGLLGDAVTFVVSAVCLSRVRPAPTPRPAADEAGASLTARIRTGIAVVRHDRYLKTLMVIGGISNFGLTGYAALLILFLSTQLGLAPTAIGLVITAGSVGGVVGAAIATPLARRIGSGRASTLLLLIGGPSALLVGIPTDRSGTWLTVLGLALVGAAVIAGNVIRGAWRQRCVPGPLFGRVLATSQIVNYGTMPLAGVVAGFLGSHLGTRGTIFVMAAIHAAACCSVLATQLGRLRELPVPGDR